MKSRLLTYSAIVAIAGATTAPALAADDQTPAEPAGTQYNPEPTIAEELVYLRDIIALQTLRLDETEQALKLQNELIEKQQAKIDSLDRALSATQMAMRGGGAMTAALAGEYIVQPGDTLGKVAAEFDTTVKALAAANHLSAPYPLRAGQRLAVPGAEAPPPVIMAAAETAPASKIEKPAEAPKKPEPQKVVETSVETSSVTPEIRPDVTRRVIQEERERDEKTPESGLPEEVGVRPEEEERPYLSLFTDVGGILTPRGTLYVEPSTDFSVSSDNRFFFQGIEIADAILIGAIDATDSDRRAFTQSLGLRYGLTGRIEVDGRISYVNRNDRISGVTIDDQTSTFRNLTGNGLGDAEMGLHYQVNNGKKFPYTIVNMRAKAPTGDGPFDVDREASGIETELATGSGYWTVEPSLTFILPSDPAVIFANVGYQLNMSTSPDAVITRNGDGEPTQTVLDFDPGDAIRTSFGVGLSLNDRLSVNFGYDQSHILRTTSSREIIVQDPILDSEGEFVFDDNGFQIFGPPRAEFIDSAQPAATVGAFLFGGSYAVSDRVRINFNTAVGATDEAPDIRVSLRAQIRLFD